MLVATSQGGIQALSRSYFAKLVPKEKSNEFFGFYNIFGKFASIMGPLLVGATAQVTGSSSHGVFSLIFLFIAGLILLSRVPDPKASIPVPGNIKTLFSHNRLHEQYRRLLFLSGL
jgi:UMF1 family MFS transporter